ncbi:hypothetical protein B0H11DRAFT_2184656 [Mycena galericulata]|nr:hypothetical protein B0H11DRAFT_2184656 [Mycena galericulata]
MEDDIKQNGHIESQMMAGGNDILARRRHTNDIQTTHQSPFTIPIPSEPVGSWTSILESGYLRRKAACVARGGQIQARQVLPLTLCAGICRCGDAFMQAPSYAAHRRTYMVRTRGLRFPCVIVGRHGFELKLSKCLIFKTIWLWYSPTIHSPTFDLPDPSEGVWSAHAIFSSPLLNVDRNRCTVGIKTPRIRDSEGELLWSFVATDGLRVLWTFSAVAPIPTRTMDSEGELLWSFVATDGLRHRKGRKTRLESTRDGDNDKEEPPDTPGCRSRICSATNPITHYQPNAVPVRAVTSMFVASENAVTAIYLEGRSQSSHYEAIRTCELTTNPSAMILNNEHMMTAEDVDRTHNFLVWDNNAIDVGRAGDEEKNKLNSRKREEGDRGDQKDCVSPMLRSAQKDVDANTEERQVDVLR